MDVRRATDLLCRSYSSLSLTSNALRSSRNTARLILRPSAYQARRALATQSSPLQAPVDETNRKVDTNADYTSEVYKSRDTGLLPPRNPSSPQSQHPRSTITERSELSRRSSVDDLISAARESESKRSTSTHSTPQSWTIPQTTSRYGVQGMQFPSTSASYTAPVTRTQPRIVHELPIHLRPRTGRSVPVNPSIPNDLGSKLRALDALVARNQIRKEFNRQKFHERPGLKRKRLATERWRRGFRNKFWNVCGRVEDLRAQGW